MKYTIKTLEDLEKFAKILARNLQSGDVYSLVGDLGAGKTTLVQMIGKEIGVDDYITSPTFALVNIYDGDFRLYHLDLYRLNNPEEIENLDFESYFYPEGISFIEWAEKAEGYLPDEMIEINIRQDNGFRQIEITKNNQRAIDLERKIDEGFSY
ncbi:MAG: tRNA (adenosine(37)-N6)-threonylcarbamoyltransferase complex ATPase subunit type 1 TsaE [Tissierellia bacterium]|nr:tRNA (adenosine(37)-N6)-threonylcarbamoyltransferase complex ATPase subunit type 1 TsaE [Tissierellia bacterium]